jgi:hypothetical protein
VTLTIKPQESAAKLRAKIEADVVDLPKVGDRVTDGLILVK